MSAHDLHVRLTRDGSLSRRSFLHRSASGLLGSAAFGWAGTVRAEADALRRRGMACTLSPWPRLASSCPGRPGP